MTLYHGSPHSGIGTLQPSLSQHGKAYVYFSTNPVIAAMYVFNPLPRPHAFFPYGFDREGKLIYEEYYKGQFEELYGGREGFLYECDDVPGAFNPTKIPHVLVSEAPVPVSRCTRIPDAAEYFLARVEKGQLRIFFYDEMRALGRLPRVAHMIREDIAENGLLEHPEHPLAVFYRAHFPELFEETEQ